MAARNRAQEIDKSHDEESRRESGIRAKREVIAPVMLLDSVPPSEPLPQFMLADHDAPPETPRELASETRLVSSERLPLASEVPTLPPPRGHGPEPVVAHIHLGPTVDEVLYRLALGDATGALRAANELDHATVCLQAPPVVTKTLRLTYLEEYLLASVDGTMTWGEMLDASPFDQVETLRAMAELVDKGAITLA